MRMSRILVITPTYNEKNNLPLLVERVCALNVPDLSLMVVDDNSPDGTGRVADDLARRYPLTVIHRTAKEGLGSAYRDAFSRALQTDAEIILHMDCDLSHDPAAIPSLLEAVKNADLVLGSRYIKGGGTENWTLSRRIISRAGNAYARFVLGLPYHDLTGGFKCYRRRTLEVVVASSTQSMGYCFLPETTYIAHKKGFRIVESPITFYERTSGKSKFALGIAIESFLRLIQVRFRRV